MNVMPDFLVNSADTLALDALLAALSAAAPCGQSARHDPVFTAIRLLREEDDPSLPMGQWERPLKLADWPGIEQRCTDMLATRSKDLQIAVWLVEAWMRQRGLVGLMHGLRLLDALLRRYWPALHPVIEADGDADARLAPLEWLNESLSASVRVHAVLLLPAGGAPAPVTLAEWERVTARETAPPDKPDRKQAVPEGGPTRADLIEAAQLARAQLATSDAAVWQCLASLQSVVDFLHQQLDGEAPNLGKLQATLEAVQRVLAQLRPDLDETMSSARPEGDDGLYPDDGARAAPASGLVATVAAAPAAARWRNRGEAYTTLEALAGYLSEVEPHSPTPYLIRRAVNWGRMSLPEVIAEIIREEGDLSRLLNVLGIRSDA